MTGIILPEETRVDFVALKVAEFDVGESMVSAGCAVRSATAKWVNDLFRHPA